MFFTNKAFIIAIGAFLIVGFSSLLSSNIRDRILSLFKSELAIDKTANVITEIKKISKFTTACYYEEKIVDHKKYKYFDRKIRKESGILSSLTSSVFSSDTNKVDVVKDSTEIGRIIYIARTKVKAGYDFSKIKEGDITVGDTLHIKLPPVEIFDVISNPSDWTTYYYEGKWENDETREIKSNAMTGFKQDAIDNGILEKAETYGKEKIAMLFKTFGFMEVNLE